MHPWFWLEVSIHQIGQTGFLAPVMLAGIAFYMRVKHILTVQ
jgi:hypothetical protein